MKYTIIADSSCDLKSADINSDKLNFVTVPLIITLGEKDYLDEESLDTNELILAMKQNKYAPKTACPSVEAFAEVMREAENVICITLSSKVSGTFNSARLASETVLEESPSKNIFVLDSLLASAGMIIIINHLKELIESEKYTFSEIVEQIIKFQKEIKVRFLLQDFGNLIKTGRMSRLSGIVAGVLIIKLICGDNGNGEIKVISKVFGLKKAILELGDSVAEKVKTHGKNFPVAINHCYNETDALALKAYIEGKYGLTNVKIYQTRGLASFYANNKGLLIGY